MAKQILSVFDYFVGLALKGLISTLFSILKKTRMQETFSYEFSPNTRKYGPEKLQIRILFAQCFSTPLKHPKTSGFLMLSWGIERDKWYEMGSKTLNGNFITKSYLAL